MTHLRCLRLTGWGRKTARTASSKTCKSKSENNSSNWSGQNKCCNLTNFSSEIVKSNFKVPVWVLVVLELNTRGIWLREFYLQAFDPVPAWWVPDHSLPGFARSLCLLVDQSWYLWNVQIFSLYLSRLKCIFYLSARLAHLHNDVWSLGTIWMWHFQRRTGRPQKSKLGKRQSGKKKFKLHFLGHKILYLMLKIGKTSFVVGSILCPSFSKMIFCSPVDMKAALVCRSPLDQRYPKVQGWLELHHIP